MAVLDCKPKSCSLNPARRASPEDKGVDRAPGLGINMDRPDAGVANLDDPGVNMGRRGVEVRDFVPGVPGVKSPESIRREMVLCGAGLPILLFPLMGVDGKFSLLCAPTESKFHSQSHGALPSS